MTASPLRDDEPNVLVCRSKLDADVWFVLGAEINLADCEHPGKVRAVKDYAERKYAAGRQVRWVRHDANTWRMRIPRDLGPRRRR